MAAELEHPRRRRRRRADECDEVFVLAEGRSAARAGALAKDFVTVHDIDDFAVAVRTERHRKELHDRRLCGADRSPSFTLLR